MLVRRSLAASGVILAALLSGCGLFFAGECAPKPVAALSGPGPGWMPPPGNSCGDLYQANGGDWYGTTVLLTEEARATLQPAGRLERAVFPDQIEDPALYALPGVDTGLALFVLVKDQADGVYLFLYPKETQPTTDVCPFIEPEPASPGDPDKPDTEDEGGRNYEYICGATTS
jgi:hypothetical protein